jgi:hypothetical protein
MKLKNLLISVAAVASLAACSNDSNMDGAAIPTFTGTIAGQTATRMAGMAWDKGDTIGITASSADNETSATNVKYATANGDGTFSPAEAANAITFGSTQKVTFSAYYPYAANGGSVTVSTAAANQTAENQKAIDFLYASGATASIINPEVKFKFNHMMSQMVLNIQAGAGVTDLSKLTKIELGDLKLSGTFNTATGETSTTGDASSLELATTIASGTTSYEESLILLPQSVTGKKLSLTLTYNNMEFSASLALTDGLLSGYSTTYDVTLNKTSVNVSGGSINPWKSSTLTAEASEVIPNPYVSADKAELYALAFTDGTYLNIWDAENNKIDEDMWSEYEDTDKTVCGIVYWLGDPTSDDGLLKADYKDCTHGLILALYDMDATAPDSRASWQVDSNDYEYSFTDFYVSDKISSMDSQILPSSYESIAISYAYTGSGDETQLNKALGYNNTKLLHIFNSNYCVYDNEKYKVLPIDYLDSFAKGYAAPNSSSGWYWPSPKELVLLVRNDTEVKFNYGTSRTDQFGYIQDILEKLEKVGMKDYYWSSSECKYTSGTGEKSYAFGVCLYSNKHGYVDYYAKVSINHLRAVCAF